MKNSNYSSGSMHFVIKLKVIVETLLLLIFYATLLKIIW